MAVGNNNNMFTITAVIYTLGKNVYTIRKEKQKHVM